MNRRSVERIGGMDIMRRVLARQHASPDGLPARFGDLPRDQEENPAFKDNSEETESIESRYILDIPHHRLTLSDYRLSDPD
jgi:hypothetical protein